MPIYAHSQEQRKEQRAREDRAVDLFNAALKDVENAPEEEKLARAKVAIDNASRAIGALLEGRHTDETNLPIMDEDYFADEKDGNTILPSACNKSTAVAREPCQIIGQSTRPPKNAASMVDGPSDLSENKNDDVFDQHLHDDADGQECGRQQGRQISRPSRSTESHPRVKPDGNHGGGLIQNGARRGVPGFISICATNTRHSTAKDHEESAPPVPKDDVSSLGTPAGTRRSIVPGAPLNSSFNRSWHDEIEDLFDDIEGDGVVSPFEIERDYANVKHTVGSPSKRLHFVENRNGYPGLCVHFVVSFKLASKGYQLCLIDGRSVVGLAFHRAKKIVDDAMHAPGKDEVELRIFRGSAEDLYEKGGPAIVRYFSEFLADEDKPPSVDLLLEKEMDMWKQEQYLLACAKNTTVRIIDRSPGAPYSTHGKEDNERSNEDIKGKDPQNGRLTRDCNDDLRPDFVGQNVVFTYEMLWQDRRGGFINQKKKSTSSLSPSDGRKGQQFHQQIETDMGVMKLPPGGVFFSSHHCWRMLGVDALFFVHSCEEKGLLLTVDDPSAYRDTRSNAIQPSTALESDASFRVSELQTFTLRNISTTKAAHLSWVIKHEESVMCF